MYTNWMQPQQNGPPGMGGDGGNLQMGRAPQPGAYLGNGTMDSPTPMAMGMMNAPVQQPRPAFNPGMGMDARVMAPQVQQPLSMPGAGGGQYSPRAPMPNGPMGGDTRYSPMAPATMPTAQQYSPRAPMPNGPPMGGNRQYSPMAPAGQPPMGGGGLDRMGGNQVYSPMAPAQMPPQQYSPMAPAQRPPQQYSPMARSPSLPPTGGAAMPRQNLRPLQFNGRAGGLFGMGDR